MAFMPKRFFIWSITSRLPAPSVKPTITECETKRVRSPSLSSVIPSCIRPISRVRLMMAARRASGASMAATTLSTAIEMALVGPLISWREESKSAPIAVITIAV